MSPFECSLPLVVLLCFFFEKFVQITVIALVSLCNNVVPQFHMHSNQGYIFSLAFKSCEFYHQKTSSLKPCQNSEIQKNWETRVILSVSCVCTKIHWSSGTDISVGLDWLRRWKIPTINLILCYLYLLLSIELILLKNAYSDFV